MGVHYLGVYLILSETGEISQDCEYYFTLFIVINNFKTLIIYNLFCSDMQGTNMSGPIPSTISRLRNLESL